jgi:hypothetical protein
MSSFEQLPGTAYHQPEKPERKEALPNRAKVTEALSHGNIERLQESAFPIDPSTNRVEQVAVDTSELVRIKDTDHHNKLQLVNVGAGPDKMLALYKPKHGEDPDVRLSTNIPNMMNRELLANRMAERIMGYEISPPIVARSIDEDLGSLQQFYSREHYATAESLADQMSPEKFDELYEACMESDDAKRIALMDFVLGTGADRHMSNYLLRHDGNLQDSPIVAIDNAIALTTIPGIVRNYQVQGPAFHYTAENTAYGTIARSEGPIAIPEHLLAELKVALGAWDDELHSGTFQHLIDTETVELDRAARQGSLRIRTTIQEELQYAKDRLETLVERGIFLSRANLRPGTIISNRNRADNQHLPPHPVTPGLTIDSLRKFART